MSVNICSVSAKSYGQFSVSVSVSGLNQRGGFDCTLSLKVDPIWVSFYFDVGHPTFIKVLTIFLLFSVNNTTTTNNNTNDNVVRSKRSPKDIDIGTIDSWSNSTIGQIGDIHHHHPSVQGTPGEYISFLFTSNSFYFVWNKNLLQNSLIKCRIASTHYLFTNMNIQK